MPEKLRSDFSSDTLVTPATILPVEKLLSSILALYNCYSFLSNTVQNMLRRSSKANDRHIYTLFCFNLFVLTAGTLPIHQNSTYKINLTFIFQIATNKHITLHLLQSSGQKCDYLGIPRPKAVTANRLMPIPNLFQRDCVSQSLTLAQAVSDS